MLAPGQFTLVAPDYTRGMLRKFSARWRDKLEGKRKKIKGKRGRKEVRGQRLEVSRLLLLTSDLQPLASSSLLLPFTFFLLPSPAPCYYSPGLPGLPSS